MPALKKKIAISIGDLNGVGFEIALRAHAEILQLCDPLYCIDTTMADQASKLLQSDRSKDFILCEVDGEEFTIQPGIVDAKSGLYSYNSFVTAVDLVRTGKADGMVTLPIHKEAWMKAEIRYVGHTDALRDIFDRDAIMMLGCEEMFVALYTEHIPLKKVAGYIQSERIADFLYRFYQSVSPGKVGVLGLNPHAGDHGVLGDEETEIETAISLVNERIGGNVFVGPLVPDTAFTPVMRGRFKYYIAMYHDQGLAPLKTLYFEEGINVSLGLPIIRTSVDHGTAFDIAYQNKASIISYINAVKAAVSIKA